MISAEVRQAIEKIRPLLDPAVADSLRTGWAGLHVSEGALGRFEDLFMHYGIVRGETQPRLSRKALFVFCGDHDAPREPASSLRDVPGANPAVQFVRGFAPASVLCRQFSIEEVVVDAGMKGEPFPGMIDARSGEGSADPTRGSALTETQANTAMENGLSLAEEAALRYDAVGIAQLGAGGNLAAAAVFAALTGRDPSESTPRPNSLGDSAHAQRVALVRAALGRHSQDFIAPFPILCAVGSLEMAMMAGFLLGAAVARLPVVIDSFESAVAALVARAFSQDSLDAAIFAHGSDDPAHRNLFDFLVVEPVFRFGLGACPGCAAAMALQFLDSAVRLNSETGR